ncbi:MAG: sulfatase [Acidobacteriota bacterium]
MLLRYSILAFAFLIVACVPPDEIPSILVRDTVIDLLAETTSDDPKRPKFRAAELHMNTDVPENAIAVLQGRAWRRHDTGEPSAPVRFQLMVDHELVVDEAVVVAGRGQRFLVEANVPATTRDVPVELRIVRPTDEDVVGEWQRVTLEQERSRSRLTTGQGRNLLIIVADTWRADHTSLHGYERATTPYLDRFASQALVFDRAFSTSPWTLPSTASLLTGLYPNEHGLIRAEPLPHDLDTLAEGLAGEGISTFAISANPLVSPDRGLAQGFEHFDYLPESKANAITDRALERLDEHRPYRFFGYLHYLDPHGPYNAPEPYRHRFTDPAYQGRFRDPQALRPISFARAPDFPVDDDDVHHLRAAYDGEILFWDHEFQRLVDGLRARHLLDDTVIIITSDHGEEFAEHGLFKHGHHLYDESVHVPLLIHAPGRVDPGRVAHQVENRRVFHAAHQLMGTGLSPPAPDDLLLTEQPFPVLLHTDNQPGLGEDRVPEVAAIRDSTHKLIWWLDTERIELYDLATDPGETQNVIDDEAHIASAYRLAIETWLRDDERGPETETPLDDELVERLRALGYIQ